MGIDFLDFCFGIEKEFKRARVDLDVRKLIVSRDAGGAPLASVTAADLLRWVEMSIAASGRDIPQDIWPRLRSCIAATISVTPDKIALESRLIEDLGFA